MLEINKVLKQRRLKPIVVGKQALTRCAISEEFVSKIENIQDATGKLFIFQCVESEEYFRIQGQWRYFGDSKKAEIPDFARVAYDLNCAESFAYEQYKLLLSTERLLNNVKEDILLKGKNASFYEKALLKLEIKHISPYYLVLKENTLSASDFLTKGAWLYLSQSDINFQIKQSIVDFSKSFESEFSRWLLILRDDKGKRVVLQGDNQAQLSSYLELTDFLERYSIHIHPDVAMNQGWDAVIARQLVMYQYVSDETYFAFSQYNKIQALLRDEIVHSHVVRNVQLTELMAEKAKYECIESTLQRSDKRRLWGRKSYRPLIAKLEKSILALQQDNDSIVYETPEIEERINEQILDFIVSYPQHKQPIPEDFLRHYFYGLAALYFNETELTSVLNEKEANGLSILIHHAECLRPFIPENIMQLYVEYLNYTVTLDNLAATVGQLVLAQSYIQSDVLRNWIENKNLILYPPEPEPIIAVEPIIPIKEIIIEQPELQEIFEAIEHSEIIMPEKAELPELLEIEPEIEPEIIDEPEVVEKVSVFAMAQKEIEAFQQKTKKSKQIQREFFKTITNRLYQALCDENASKEELPEAVIHYYVQAFEKLCCPTSNKKSKSLNEKQFGILDCFVERALILSDRIMKVYVQSLRERFSMQEEVLDNPDLVEKYSRLKAANELLHSSHLAFYLEEIQDYLTRQQEKIAQRSPLKQSRLKAFFKSFLGESV